MGDMTTEPAGGNAGKGGEIDITCTPDLPNADDVERDSADSSCRSATATGATSPRQSRSWLSSGRYLIGRAASGMGSAATEPIPLA
jgi:hypothetical protein